MLFLLNSCVETFVAGAAITGVVVSRQKTFSNSKGDILIATQIRAKFLTNGLKNPGNNIDVTVDEGRVLLTGIVRKQSYLKLATKFAFEVKNVKEVINEVRATTKSIGAKSFTRAIKDGLITSKLSAKLLFAKGVSSINYTIDTVDGIVYIIGIAADEYEMDKVTDLASKIGGVRQVVNYIILEDDIRRK